MVRTHMCPVQVIPSKSRLTISNEFLRIPRVQHSYPKRKFLRSSKKQILLDVALIYLIRRFVVKLLIPKRGAGS